ncbi:nitroreductase [Quisquiliibacterium transsilvanicum]|uniref:Nitroreductase n=1 Tax=Quisquiliibacterium transsilvanicum TaxID=1549638 RepID=A0A7W8HK55_9BURK|nr:nitroreductase [Quisquiliibacterium transsilvanicum]MBB5273574.1 nitroreductase [Quisquiliibacterium transsilvanicum]
MDLVEAINSRRSVRGFLNTPVPTETIRRVLAIASRAPSGGNVQPWQIQVVAGEPLAQLKATMLKKVEELPGGDGSEYDIYPKELVSPHRDYRFKLGEDMYAQIGIPREDKAGRKRWFARNFQFFGAPMALFCTIDRRMGPPQWSDCGMFLQTVMLMLRAEGLDSCPQECWAIYPKTIGEFLELPPEQMLFCGMAIGQADPGEPANRLYADRAPLEAFTKFRGL